MYVFMSLIYHCNNFFIFQNSQMDYNSTARTSVKILKENSFLDYMYEWYYEMFKNEMSFKIVEKFWSDLSGSASNSKYKVLFDAFTQLHHCILKWINNPIFKLMFEDETLFIKYQNKMKNFLRAVVNASSPLTFYQFVLETYSTAFKIYQMQIKKSSSNQNDESFQSQKSNENDYEIPDYEIDEINSSFITFNTQLKQLNLHDVLAGDAVTSVVHSFIEKHIKDKCQGNFEVSCINSLKSWIEGTVIQWVNLIYDGTQDESNNDINERLIHFLYETYAQYRMDQLFDIIIEFPDSEPSLEDLKECLEKCVNFRAKLIESLQSSLELRLLHPGVSTSDILAAYISAIKALRVVDPTGVILQLVCEPVRSYLKSRDDTVRCIITALTDDNSSELTPEFVKGNTQSGDDSNYNSDDENIAENWQQWQPDPIDAQDSSASSKTLRSLDIVSILVNIYESKDLFVEEYQRLLGQRLLTNFECNIEYERRNLELLTLRFGESDLHACEVMLKDVEMSKRISQRINSGEIESYKFEKFPMNSLILSAQFWPEKFGLAINEDLSTLKIPNEMSEAADMFTKAFETIKVNRTLNWVSYLGKVQLELEFDDRKLNFSVTPIQATIIHHFQEKESWTIAELSEVISIPPSILRKRISFWQNKGILKETKTDKFDLIKDQKGNLSSNLVYSNDNMLSIEEDFDDLGNEKAGSSNQDDQDGKFTVYWSFIQNMLNNLNSLPLERIYTMLQMFAMQGSSQNELTNHELRHFLDSKVKEHKLVYTNGQYKLPEAKDQ